MVHKNDEKVSKEKIKDKDSNFKVLKHKLSEKKKEAEENKELAQRIKAEFDNYKKRVLNEYEQNIKLANEFLIKKLLNVIDAFERSLDINNIEDEKFKSYYNGTELIYKQLKDILIENGLEKIHPEKDESFNPAFHEAMIAEDLDDDKEHIVLDVFEKGYSLSGRLLRAAKVKVGNKK